jgi:Flp pilus assembly protein TadD
MSGIEDPAVQCARSDERAETTNTFIATLYFNQATGLLRRGAFAESEAYLHEVLRLWPDHPGALNNLGTAVWQQGRGDEAEAHYRRALELAADDFAVLNNLGNALWEQSRPAEAVEYYNSALRVQADSPETQMNLGVALSDLGEFDEALRWLQESLQRRPASPEALDNLGMTLARMGRWDEALSYYEQALFLRPEYPEAHRNRAYAWLARGDLARGFPEYEWRLKCRNYRGLVVDRPRWRGEALVGRSILLHSEQGLGDTLQFMRFASLVKARGARIVVACPEPLVRLLARARAVDHAQDWKSSLPACDIQFPLISLPAILGATLENLPADVPYLAADAPTIERWGAWLTRQCDGRIQALRDRGYAPQRVVKIGIAWQGNPLNRVDRWRSFPLRLFAHLATVPGAMLVSLQKGHGTDQLAGLEGRFPVIVPHDLDDPEHDDRDLLDTAALMSHLDLVVTPESAVAHLAGSLGVKVWVALAANSDWRWLFDREDSPWYPTMTLFRQATPGDWDGVFERMAQRLTRELTV